MDSFRITVGAATIAFILGGLWGGTSLPSAKGHSTLGGISPEKVADYVQAVLDADRMIYTTHIVNRMQEHGGVVSSGKKQYFQAIYPDRAVSSACVTCHNSHPLSPKQDFKLNEVLGGIVITIPLE